MGYNSKILADAIKKLNERKVASKPKDIPLDVKGNGMLDPRFAGKPVKLNTDTLYNPTPYKIKAVADNGTERILNPFDESDVYFPGANTITEYPIGEYIDAELTDEERKVFDPNAKYYQDGGISYSNLPTIYQSALQNFIYPNVEEDSERVGYNSVSGTINYDSQSPIENMDNDWWREHEMFHHLQNQAGGMSTSGIVGQRPNPYAASDESMQGYYNRRDADVERTIDNMISQDPNLQFIPRDKLAQSNFDEETGKPIFIGAEDLQYSDPSTLEGEARQYEQYIKEGNPSIFSKKQNGGVTLPDDYIELDLSPEEIEQYAKGGYVVEELPEMQPGGSFKPGTGYKMPALNKSEIAAVKKEVSKAKPVATKLTGTVGKSTSSSKVPVKKTFGVTPSGKKVITTVSTKTDEIANKAKEDAAYEKFLDQNLGKEGSNTYTYVDPRTGKTEQREYSNAHLKDKGNISVDEATWNANRDRQNMQHLSEALSGVGEITGINSAIRTGERLIDDPLKFAGDLTTGISQAPETLVEGAMTLGSKLFGDNKDYVDVDTDALGVALDVAGALPVFGVAGKAAKPVLKTGTKYLTKAPLKNASQANILSKYRNIEELRLANNQKTFESASKDFPDLFPTKESFTATKNESKKLLKKYKPEFEKKFGKGTDDEILLYGAHEDLGKLQSNENFLINDEFAKNSGLTNDLTNQQKFLGDAYQLEFSGYFNNNPGYGGNKQFAEYLSNQIEPVIGANKLKAPAQVRRTSSFNRPVKTMRGDQELMINYDDLLEGDVIYPEHNWSTTTDMTGNVWGSGDPTSKVAIINVPEGQSAFRPNMYTGSQYVNEQELLLPSKLGYKVSGVNTKGFGSESPRFIFDIHNPYKEGGYINKMSKGGEAIKVINYLMSQGLTRQQASGIAGNLQQESSFRPNAKGSLGHVGIAQWDKNDRWPKVKKYIESQGLDPFSLDGQLAGLVWEAKKRKDWDKILKTKTPEESAQTWLKHFEISGEKPGQKGYENRLKYAKSLATQRDPNSPFDESVRDLFRLEAYREGLKNKSSVTASNEIPYRGIRYNYPTEGSSSNIDPLLTGAMKFNDDVTLDDIKPKKESSDLFASLLNMISAQEKEKEQEKLTEDPRQEVLKLLANQYPIPYSVIGNNSHQSFVNPYVYANDLSSFEKGGQKCPEGQVWDPETKSCRTTVKGYFDMLADAYKGSSLEKGIKTATKKVKDLGSEIAKTPVGQEAIKNYNDIIERDIIKIEDNRKIRATTGQPINPNRDLMSGEYNWHVVTNIINRAKKEGVDPYTALAIGLQESQLGKTDKENIGHSLYTNFKEDPYSYISFYKQKLNEADKANVSDEAARIQYYNGLGIVTPKTESNYHGYDMQSIYGVPIPSGGINLKNNPLYGKQIIDLRDNILKQNDRINQYIQNYKQDGGVANNYIETYIPEEDIKKYLDDGYNVVEF